MGAVVSNVANVLVILVIARWLGGEAVGQYTIAFAMRALLLLVCSLGMRTAMTRFVAAHLARAEHDAVRGSVLGGTAAPLGLAVAVAGAWFVLAGPLAADVFGDPALEVPLQLFALSLPFFVLQEVALAATQGFMTMRPYVWVGQVLEPGGRLALTLGVLVGGGGIVGVSWALLLAGVAGGVAASVALAHMLAAVPGSGARTPWRDLTSFGALSWLASMATQGVLWADIVILGVLVTSAEVGAYQVAARVVLIGMFVITPLTASMAPRIAHHWARGDAAAVTERYRAIVLWSARLSMPVLTGLVAAREPVLAIFGPGFDWAAPVVAILAVGAFAESFGAPSSVLLNQIERTGVNVVINVSALVGNLALNLLLIPRWGIEGAAVAWAVTLAAAAAVRVVCLHRFGVAPWPGDRQLGGAVAGALAGGVAAWLVGTVAPDAVLPAVGLAALVTVVVDVAVVVAVGLSRSERQALSRVVARYLPELRRWRARRRLRGAVVGTVPLPIDAVIGPYRGDVLARAELFRCARERADLRREDPAAFVALMRAGPYGGWFEHVVVGRGHVADTSPAALDRTFRAIVEEVLELFGRHQRHRHAALDPVTVTWLPAGTELEGWSVAEDRPVLLDGGHRVALMLVQGRGTLGPGDYVVVPFDPAHPPPNNTRTLLEAGVLAPDVVLDLVDGTPVRGLDRADRADRADRGGRRRRVLEPLSPS